MTRIKIFVLIRVIRPDPRLPFSGSAKLLPSLMRSLTAPATSSMGTFGSMTRANQLQLNCRRSEETPPARDAELLKPRSQFVRATAGNEVAGRIIYLACGGGLEGVGVSIEYYRPVQLC